MNLSFLLDCIPETRLHLHAPLSAYTSFKVGGPAEALVEVESEEELLHVIQALQEWSLSFQIIGRGTNLLVSDRGFEGVVIKMGIQNTHTDGHLLHAGAGLSLKQLFAYSLEQGFSGLEFAAGIPGSVGGAVCMNAGAYGGEMKDVLHSVRILRPDNTIIEATPDDLALGYRSSNIRQNGYVVLSASFSLSVGNVQASRAKADAFMERRRAKQPLAYPSAGSTFKRPKGNFAGTLIESCGLKGASCGGAQVSAKHAGFIINAHEATASDIDRLIREVQKVVWLYTGITLETEVQRIGVFS